MKNRIHEGVTSGSGWCHFKMPPSVVARFSQEPLVSDFLITHLGFFPRCTQHEALRPHALQEGIFILCLTGRGWVAHLGEPDAPRKAVEPGDALLIAPGVPHHYTADPGDPWSIIWFHFARDLTVADVAHACHVSRSWLFHAFPEHTGFTPMSYAIHLRLQEACRLLSVTDQKVADIAAAVGYADAFYFSRLFKKHIGLSPDTYRRQYSR